MKDLYIYHHLGLGDHIVCNGIVNHYAELYDRIFLFVKPQYLKNISQLYRGNSKIRLIPFDDHDAKHFISFNKNNKYLIIGHRPMKDNEMFDEVFYNMAGQPLSDKWDKFSYKRDLEKEKHVFYNVLRLKDNEEFVFIQDKPQFPIKLSGIKSIKSSMDIDFFDYLYTLEKAKEIHCLNSSFNVLIDCIQLRNDGLFLYNTSVLTNLKLNWKIIEL